MNPNQFLAQDDVAVLQGGLVKFAGHYSPAARADVLAAADVQLPNLDYYATPTPFSYALIHRFKQYCVSEQRPGYHPMDRLLKHLVADREEYGLDDDEVAAFNLLIDRATLNFDALANRRSVGRIEIARDNGVGVGIGTGTLIGPDLLLTCLHVLTKSPVPRARVRFGYKLGCDGSTVSPGKTYDLELGDEYAAVVAKDAILDYALIKVQGSPAVPQLRPAALELDTGQRVRAIHYPRGAPVEVTELGRITHVDTPSIRHTIQTADGSSGAPIFDEDWQFVALHRGYPGMEQTRKDGPAGVPIRAIWERLEGHL